MKAMIFAAGLGTRLGTITQTMPKALVEVGGVPMLERVILRLKASGISDMTVNVHHHADDIIDFIRSNDFFGVNIHISDERDFLLDTGGGLLKARRFLDGNEPILLHNADILTDFSITDMKDAHEKSGVAVTLLVAERDTSRYLLFDNDNRMKGWLNKRTGEIRSPFKDINLSGFRALAFGGIHIVNPYEVFPQLESYAADPKFSITPFYVDMCRDLEIKGFMPPHSYKWIDIGKPESLTAAENIVSELRPIQPEA